MLITEEYRELNRQLHVVRESFGKSSCQWVELIFDLCAEMGTTDVLDYGCGKGELHLGLPFGINNYDPAVRKYAKAPEPADIVVCTDVLEHIEPNCLDDVLTDLRRCVKRCGLLGIPTYKAKAILPDGRNAHLIVEPPEWWQDKITAAGFKITREDEYLTPRNDVYYMAMVE